jgi:hypothetical protein
MARADVLGRDPSSGFDAGLLSAASKQGRTITLYLGPPYCFPGGSYSQTRLSVCVVAGDPLSSCSDSPYSAVQWSISPYVAHPFTP